MAPDFYLCNHLSHKIYEPRTMPATHQPAPRSVQIEATVTVDLLIFNLDCLTRSFTGFNACFTQETLRFGLNLLENYFQAHKIVDAMFRRLKIEPSSFAFTNIVIDIILHAFTIGNRESNRGPKVLPLRVEIRVTVEKLVNIERVLMRRAVEESASASNCGMVPAEESSVRKMMKRLRLEDDKKGKDCVICLEEIKVGSDPSQMPCSHIFHATCIEQWLKQSHYCPVCRFKMPISKR